MCGRLDANAAKLWPCLQRRRQDLTAFSAAGPKGVDPWLAFYRRPEGNRFHQV